MCSRCEEIDAEIERYQRLITLVSDKAVLEILAKLIVKLNIEKVGLHLDPK